MAKEKGPWKVKNSEIVYKSNFVKLQVDKVDTPDGNPGDFATVTLRKGVAVLPIDENGNVFLVQQYRYGIEEVSIEVVSGGIEENEPPLQTAKKELKEEAGIVAEKYTSLGMINMDTSIVICPVYFFIAEYLTIEEQEQEGTENIKILKLPLHEAVTMVLEGKITHSPSCVLLLKASLIYK